jgi:hypothetical protein
MRIEPTRTMASRQIEGTRSAERVRMMRDFSRRCGCREDRPPAALSDPRDGQSDASNGPETRASIARVIESSLIDKLGENESRYAGEIESRHAGAKSGAAASEAIRLQLREMIA